MTPIVNVETNGAPNFVAVSSPTSTSPVQSATAVKVSLPTVKLGQAGEAVRFIQQRLKSMGYQIAFNGQFGLQTDAAIKHFQSYYSGGLLVDGVVGEKTWKALCEHSPIYGSSFYFEFVTSTYAYDVHMPTLQKGMEGLAVACLQERLIGYTYRGKIDGIFGEATRTAVINYQKGFNLNPDGLVGRLTWRTLGDTTDLGC